MRSFCQLLPLLALAGSAAATTNATTAPASQKPNVVLLVIDELGWADVSMHHGDFPTPNLDGLARSGIELSRMYVQPVCSPTRSALMTARYPHKLGFGTMAPLPPACEGRIPTDKQTTAEAFAAAGFETAAVGKWYVLYTEAAPHRTVVAFPN